MGNHNILPNMKNSQERPRILWFYLLLFLWGLSVEAQSLINRAPHFLPGGDMARFSLPEDTKVGTPVYRLRGLDPEGSSVHYSISGEQLTVDRKSGIVSLLRPLDRESVDLVEVIISITDEGIAGSEPNTVSLRREIPILDVNDNAPEFQGRPYSFAVAETTRVGTTVFSNITITDKDGGVNADIILSCAADKDNEDACSTFDVATEKITEGEYVGIISLLKPLDYEQRAGYSLVLKATDVASESSARLTAVANVAIDVMDIQDQPPVFLNSPFSATVAEGTAPGTSVLNIRARDGDSGDPRNVTLAIEGDVLGYFSLVQYAHSPTSAVSVADLVTSNKSIDREHPDIFQNGGIYVFSVKATELINNELPGDTATSQVTIVITDVDDQVPVFNEDNFHISVSEDIGADTPLPGLNMVVNDRDVGENARYTLKLRDVKNSAGTFTVHPSVATGRTPVVIRVANVKGLDYDVEDPSLRKIVFDVVAVVKGKQDLDVEVASARVTVDLVDANDNSPVFPQSAYRIRVLENVRPGSLISNITAKDVDSKEFGSVTYSIKGFGSEKFYTQSKEGGLYVAKSSPGLDYETQKSYSLTFEARDGGGRVSTANLFVEVEDVNDNAPVFEQREYGRTVREGATSFQPQLFVRAIDADGPDQGGGKIFYSIQSSNVDRDVFFVEPVSGEVKMNSPVNSSDTPRGQYELMIRATDAGKPPLHEETRVLIRVGVPGNQRPIFRGNRNVGNGPSSYAATVQENAEPETEVVQVMATDPDGQDSLLNYFIAGGARDNFVINERSGQIRVSPDARLDLETGGSHYDIIVHAVDSGTPIRETATATVAVEITDVNNKPPVFQANDASAFVRYVSERVPVGEHVLTVKAVDPDSDAKVVYSIVEPIKAADRTGVALKSIVPYNYKAAFKINSTTGEVFVAKSLDHQAAAVIIITIQANDVNAVEHVQDQFAKAEVTIYIQAYNNSNPVFTISTWTPTNPVIKVAVREEQRLGATLMTLSAKDPLDGRIISKFEEVKGAQDFVSVDPHSGDIILNKRLDYESLQQKSFSLQVHAISDDDKRTSEATVIIEVQDINDNSPQFSQESYKTRVFESAKYPEKILTVKANDLDINDNKTGYGTIRYSLNGGSAALFDVDPVSGVVKIAPNVTLDREKQPLLRFNVVASDTPQGGSEQRKSIAVVLVDVLDVNDNAPSFTKRMYSAVVPENVAVGTDVTTVTAVDPDDGGGGQITYDLSNEGEANGLFAINHTTGHIKTQKALTGKGRTEPYHLIVRAQDGGNPSLSMDVPLSIYIGDVFTNDGVPLFIRPTFNEVAKISENSSIGSPVFQVMATDPDDPNSPNGKISYKFLDDGLDAVAFNIDDDTGLISTRLLLDREQKENYSLIVVIQDHGDPPQQASRVLQVQVLDIDDHKPLFKRGLDDEPQGLTIREEVDIGTEVGTVEAVDDDIGENGMIDYLITYGNEDGLFSIMHTSDNKGMITVAKRLDREAASEHLITVKCFKKSSRPRSLRKQYNRQDPSERQVRIIVLDIDDNKPVFTKENITIGVRLNVPVDKKEANDIDSDAQPITYSLVNSTFFSLAPSIIDTVPVSANHSAVFRLDNKTGELRTASSMVGFVDGFFELDVTANNSEFSGREVNTTVKIFVLRDRDLLKFVFSKPPTDVRRVLNDFQREVEKALLLPVSLNIYDTQFYAKEDGSLDFSSTSSCFQLVGKESYDLNDMQSLLQDPSNIDLNKVYDKYNVEGVQRCAPLIVKAEASWIQLWVLAIACFIGLGALMAGIATCCLHGRYKRHVKRSLLRDCPRVPVSSIGYLSGTGASSTMIITPSAALSEGPRMYEWAHDGPGLPPGHDNMSYHSFPTRW
ncbi:Cadherin-23 [Zootermopsis nevadensis]|uniref:Cadherin-23 n=3 Tax=Zootermopsis nevadensis TaxID=136037 RepID=A0A067QQC1_ZOONE|nr:Cadherin-23 [Zootermopsis nevadensis]